MIRVAAFLFASVGMEGVAYCTHRWLMHGRGIVWHASHHEPARPGVERNDLFPLCFAVVGVASFALAGVSAAPAWSWAAAAGVTAYGMAYMAVHEIVIHRRVPLRIPEVRYLRWLRESHRAHHVDGGEPYGMLLPLMGEDRRRVAAAVRIEADGDDLLRRRASTRSMRSRL